MARIEWTGDRQMIQAMRQYDRRVRQAIESVAQYWAAAFEAYAKRNAPWTDRTANARQSLHGYTGGNAPTVSITGVEYPDERKLSQDTVTIFLSHGVVYGQYLETNYAGKYSIIWPTIKRHLPRVERMLQEIFQT
jgi:hypothetical protein